MRVMLVYGTLRPGISANVFEIPGALYDMGGFPGALLNPDFVEEGQKIVVERCVVSESRVPSIDNYEGYYADRPLSSLFIRQKIADPLLPDEEAEIYVYNFQKEEIPDYVHRIIPDGDWLRFRGQTFGSAHSMMGPQVAARREPLRPVGIGHNRPDCCPSSLHDCQGQDHDDTNKGVELKEVGAN